MKKKVLIVDDDINLLLVHSMYFQTAGLQTITAENGQEAIKALKTEIPDIFMVDLMMPVMDGLEFLKWLRTDAKNNCPVIMLTAVIDKQVENELMENGATYVLNKPIQANQIVNLIKEL